MAKDKVFDWLLNMQLAHLTRFV